MAREPNRDRSKLPKWVRDELERLERNAQSMAQRLAAGPADSDTFADPYSEHPRPLGRGTSIRFQLDDNDRDYVEVRLDRDSYYLEVRTSERMSVEPRASNVVHIRNLDR